MAKDSGLLAPSSADTLGVRKLKRLLLDRGKSPYWLSGKGEGPIERIKLSRLLKGRLKRLDLEFVLLIVQRFPDELRAEDFASWTVEKGGDRKQRRSAA